MKGLNFTVDPPVSAVDQGNADLCWLAATAVLFAWRDRHSVSMQDAANRLGVEFIAKYGSRSPLSYDDLALWKSRAGFASEGQQCLAADGWDRLLRAHGPLVTLVDGVGTAIINHAVVVYGVAGDGTAGGTSLKVANGQGGKLQTLTLSSFVTIFEMPEGSNQLFSVSYLR